MSVTTLDVTSSALSWSGKWDSIVQQDAYGGSVQATTENGATMRYLFGSGSVAIYGTVPACSGSVAASIYVDNQIQVAQRFRCGSYSQSGVQFFESIPLSPADGGVQHVIQVTNGGSAPLYLDRLDVADFVEGQTPSFTAGNPPPTPSPSRSPTSASQSPNSSSTQVTSSANSSTGVTTNTTPGTRMSSQTASQGPTSPVTVSPLVIQTTINGVITTISLSPNSTSAGAIPSASAGDTPSKKSSNLPTIAAALSTVIGLLLLGGVVLFLCRRRRRNLLLASGDRTVSAPVSATIEPFQAEGQSSPSASDEEAATQTHAPQASVSQLKASIFPAEKMPTDQPEVQPLERIVPTDTAAISIRPTDSELVQRPGPDVALEDTRYSTLSDVPPAYESVQPRSNRQG